MDEEDKEIFVSSDSDNNDVEDYEILQLQRRNFIKKTSLKIDYSLSNLKNNSMSLSNLKLKGLEIKDEKYINILKDSLETIYPLFYLNPEQKKFLLKKVYYMKIEEKILLYSGNDKNYDDGGWNAFILLEGEIHFFNNTYTFLDLISEICLFGYDGPIFEKRLSTVIAEKNTVLAIIKKKDFLELIHPFSRFAIYLSRNIRNKDKILDKLQSFKNYILNSINKGPIDFPNLINLYKKIHPCLHQKADSEELDISAWTYALNRLPANVIECYIYVLVNKQPRILNLNEELGDLKLTKIKTTARLRDTYKYLNGKNLVVLRDMESDVIDFVSNMCIHYIESKKIRKRIYSPLTISELNKARNNFEEAFNVFCSKTGIYIYDDEKKILKQFFGDSFGEKLIQLCLNHQDICISINKSPVTDKDSVEYWTQSLWTNIRKILKNEEKEEINDLVVDIFQGSKRTLLWCVCPHMYKHKEEILKWAEENKIQTKTKKFLNENDKLIAYSYYYYKQFPEKDKEKEEMNKEYGITYVEKTYGTGVGIVIIDVNKLKPEYIDPNIKIKPASKNHIILHIGYTFGNQSHDIIKPILMLLGKTARSLNIIGKAGGLTGNRSDILIADRMFLDKTHELVTIKTGKIDKEGLEKSTETKVHVGPMLTVAGTIVQNYDLLNFYKYINGCIGLEMEGYYFVKEIESHFKHNIINDIVTRCYYYVSDLPLDPTQNLSQEGQAVSWEEGVGTMNAIQRNVLNLVFDDK